MAPRQCTRESKWVHADTNIDCNDIGVTGHEGVDLVRTGRSRPRTFAGIEFHSLKPRQAYSSSDRVDKLCTLTGARV